LTSVVAAGSIRAMRRRYRSVMQALLRDVVRGDLPNAAWLPREREIAARFACSRAVAREAIRALEERRIVSVQAGEGQQVLPDDRWNLLDRDVATAVLLDARDLPLLREAVEAVQVVETTAGMLAARRAGMGDATLLDDIVERMRVAADGEDVPGQDDFLDAEATFHRTLALISGNRYLASMLEDLNPVLAALRRRRMPQRDTLVVLLHERIVAALRARDATATAAAVEDYNQRLAGWLGAAPTR
jgi:DNA-binding FadR family transcriptional regulator